MSDEEWAFFAPFLVRTGERSGRPPGDHRRILDGVFWIARTGVPWRDLHEHF
jgi:transposase